MKRAIPAAAPERWSWSQLLKLAALGGHPPGQQTELGGLAGTVGSFNYDQFAHILALLRKDIRYYHKIYHILRRLSTVQGKSSWTVQKIAEELSNCSLTNCCAHTLAPLIYEGGWPMRSEAGGSIRRKMLHFRYIRTPPAPSGHPPHKCGGRGRTCPINCNFISRKKTNSADFRQRCVAFSTN